MKKFIAATLVVSTLSVFASQLTGCAAAPSTGVEGVSFGMSPRVVAARLPATDNVVSSDEDKIITAGPSDQGMELKTFSFVDGRLHCVKHQLMDKSGHWSKASRNLCQ